MARKRSQKVRIRASPYTHPWVKIHSTDTHIGTFRLPQPCLKRHVAYGSKHASSEIPCHPKPGLKRRSAYSTKSRPSTTPCATSPDSVPLSTGSPAIPSPDCYLLNLPAELRNRIYDLVLIQPTPIKITTFKVRMGRVKQPPLTRVSLQIRKDTLPFFYRENVFHFQRGSGFVDVLKGRFRKNMKRYIPILRHIEVSTKRSLAKYALDTTSGFTGFHVKKWLAFGDLGNDDENVLRLNEILDTILEERGPSTSLARKDLIKLLQALR